MFIHVIFGQLWFCSSHSIKTERERETIQKNIVHFYRRRLSHILDKPSTSVFLIWYRKQTYDVVSTLIRRCTMLYDVVSTLKWRCVSTGTKYITWYTRYIISSVTFNFWKTWHNDYKCDIPGISHEKPGLTNHFLDCYPFPCCITVVHRYSSVTFAQYNVTLFNYYEKHTGN